MIMIDCQLIESSDDWDWQIAYRDGSSQQLTQHFIVGLYFVALVF